MAGIKKRKPKNKAITLHANPEIHETIERVRQAFPGTNSHQIGLCIIELGARLADADPQAVRPLLR